MKEINLLDIFFWCMTTNQDCHQSSHKFAAEFFSFKYFPDGKSFINLYGNLFRTKKIESYTKEVVSNNGNIRFLFNLKNKNFYSTTWTRITEVGVNSMDWIESRRNVLESLLLMVKLCSTLRKKERTSERRSLFSWKTFLKIETKIWIEWCWGSLRFIKMKNFFTTCVI